MTKRRPPPVRPPSGRKRKPDKKGASAAAAPPARSPSAAFRPKAVPDALAQADVRAIRDGTPHDIAGTLKRLAEARKAEPWQKAIEECGKAARQFFNAEDARKVIGSMIGVRQAYVVLYRELQDQLAAFAESHPDCPPELEDYLVQLAMTEASKPFSEHTFMDGMTDTVLRFLVDVIDRHTEKDEATRREDAEAAEKERRESPVPLPFGYSLFQETPELSRTRSLVLAGWRNAVFYLLNMAAESASGRFMTVQFSESYHDPAAQHARLARIGPSLWKGCADSDRAMALCTGQHVADRLSCQPDLLVVDNLAPAYTKGFIGRAPEASAGDAHKRIRKWCDNAGCALLGGVPLEDGDFDIRAPQFEQLRTFTDLVPVTATREGDGYRIVVGDPASPAAVVEADAARVDRHGSTLAMPAGTTMG